MFHLAIIADDLTGAMDTGVQFVKNGLRTVVSLGDRLAEGLNHEAEVVVLNTNSRPDDQKTAAAKVLATGAYARALGVGRAYKKIDSTLRGNVGPELDALMDAWEEETAVLTPAFPAVGRTVVSGRLLVNGTPWEKTQYAEDRAALTSDVAELIGTRRRTAAVELADIAAGPEALTGRMLDLARSGVGVIVADAVEEEDLLAVATAAVRAGLDRVLCGSGGMAEVLPTAMGIAAQGVREAKRQGETRPVLVIAGTVNRVTIEQVRQAAADCDAASLEVLPHSLKRDAATQRARVARACEVALRARRDLVVTSVPLSADAGASMEARDAAVAESLGPVVASALRPEEWAGIVLTGGDTAVAVCEALGAGSLEILGEVEPGVPYGRLLDGVLVGQLVVTKAGGFGSPDTIANAIRFIRGGTK